MRALFLSFFILFVCTVLGNAQGISTGSVVGGDLLDTQKQEYLERMRIEDPVTYRFLMKKRQDDPESFEQTVRAGVLREKFSKSMAPESWALMNKMLEDIKQRNGVTDADINNFLRDLSQSDPEKYKFLMKSRGKDPAVEMAILQQVIAKKKGLTGIGNINTLDSVMLPQQLRQLAQDYKNAPARDKYRLKQQLRALVSKSFDAYIASLDVSIKSLSDSLQNMKQTREDFIKNREQKIEERLQLYLQE